MVSTRSRSFARSRSPPRTRDEARISHHDACTSEKRSCTVEVADIIPHNEACSDVGAEVLVDAAMRAVCTDVANGNDSLGGGGAATKSSVPSVRTSSLGAACGGISSSSGGGIGLSDKGEWGDHRKKDEEHEEAVGLSRGSTVCYGDGDEETWLVAPSVLATARSQALAAMLRPVALSDPSSLQRPSFLFSGLRARPFWPPSMFARTVALLEAAAKDIRAEVLAMLEDAEEGESDDDGCETSLVQMTRPVWEPQREGLHAGVWQKLELWARGHPLKSNCAAAPRTAAALEAAPDMLRKAPLASVAALGCVGDRGARRRRRVSQLGAGQVPDLRRQLRA
eukprot:TRINITY_DN22096_c1_g2_i1.p1 TRINITY_DN22096_c1_g2~~TRINITY_DN22096_c1_g2_i1.p1  ORF type:complete len:338 (+),score=72.86 TRINITY_DN22096_c1_g2_i1:310-1323(+)